uniref:Uncharacterized protein n=1 Tax=Lepeophtheirus salmonis TaxID=72036 RepID=A0A0K2T7X3_LEPSM
MSQDLSLEEMVGCGIRIVEEHEENRDVKEEKCTAQYIWSNVELK